MRILSDQEKIKRGCGYCAHVDGTVKKVCPYDECHYHELDEFDTYSEYLKRLLSNKGETNIVEKPSRVRFESGKSMPGWYADSWRLPKEDRAKLRSKTFPGIARAMATQWSEV